MDNLKGKTFVVLGATGRQGSAVVRHLLREGAMIRAVTRDPQSKKARPLTTLGSGVEIVTGNMGDLEALKNIFRDAAGVFSVQNPYTSSIADEVRQGVNVADAARAAGVSHVVQASTGFGEKSGVPSWDSKLEIQAYMESLGLPLTVVRPTAFMELISDPEFYPMAAVFHLMPKLIGPDKKIPWLAVDDLGAITARVFADPQQFIGQDLKLVSDLQSIEAIRALYLQVLGKKPPHFPMPEFLFRLFTGDDLLIMWRYLGATDFNASTDTAFDILPGAQTIQTWLAAKKLEGL